MISMSLFILAGFNNSIIKADDLVSRIYFSPHLIVLAAVRSKAVAMLLSILCLLVKSNGCDFVCVVSSCFVV